MNKLSVEKPIKKKQKIIPFFCFLFFWAGISVSAQEDPPIPITVEVNTSQFLNFGSFIVGTNGGTISVDANGQVIATGDIFPLSSGEMPTPALFDITANPGSIIQITPVYNIPLKGGESNVGIIYLDINSFSTGQTFITTAAPPLTNPVYVGGTLRIENSQSAPPGKYFGSFQITFIYQ